MPIVVRLDVELARRKMSVGEFAERVGLTPANVAVLKNGRAKAVRFSTLENMCRVLDCQPGDLLEWVDECGRHPRCGLRDTHEISPNPLVAPAGGVSSVAR